MSIVFLYLLKTPKNRRFSEVFQGVEKRTNRMKWAKPDFEARGMSKLYTIGYINIYYNSLKYKINKIVKNPFKLENINQSKTENT